jgi:predicted O-linked N-acetylglucosamine transferase (SPINDLY family)
METFTKKSFDLEDDWFIYLLPQSVFKIHPLYDNVMGDILAYNQNIHLVVTGGRRPIWTKTYYNRLVEAIDSKDRIRLHLIERVSSEKFNALLKIADVILHPFPFDGITMILSFP